MAFLLLVIAGDAFAHIGVGHDIAVAHVVHHSQIAAAERFGDGHGDLGLGFDDLGAHLLGAGGHFLFGGHGGGATDFGFGLGDVLVGFGLTFLEGGTDVLSDIDVGDIDGEDFEGGVGVETFFQHPLGDVVGIFQHILVTLGGADGGDDAFVDPCDDGLFGGAPHEAIKIGAHGHPGAGAELDAVAGHGVDFSAAPGAIDHGGIDGGADGLKHGLGGTFHGEIDGAGAIEGQGNAGLVGGDESENDLIDLAASHIVSLQLVGGILQTGFSRRDPGIDDERRRHFAQPHGHEGEQAHRGVRHPGPDPDAEKFHQDEQDDEGEDDADNDEDGFEDHDEWGGIGKITLLRKVAVADGLGSKIGRERRCSGLADGKRFWYPLTMGRGRKFTGKRSRKRLGMVAVAVCILGGLPLHADVTLVYGASPEAGGVPAPTHQVHVRDGKLSIANARDKRLLIFDASTGEARVVDHAARRVAVLDRSGVEKMAAELVETQRQVLADMENRLRNLPSDEREALRRVMDELHAASAPDAVRAPPQRSFEDTGKVGKVLGKSARQSLIREGDRQVGTGWVLDPEALGIDEEDAKMLEAFEGFFEELTKGLTNALRAQWGQLGMLIPGGEILGRLVEPGAEGARAGGDEAPRVLLELLKVDAGEIEPGWFEIPESFSETALDRLSASGDEAVPGEENLSRK